MEWLHTIKETIDYLASGRQHFHEEEHHTAKKAEEAFQESMTAAAEVQLSSKTVRNNAAFIKEVLRDKPRFDA